MAVSISRAEALSILEKETLRNINMMNFIRNYQVDDLRLEGEALLARGISDRPWVYLSVKDEAELNSLTPLLKTTDDHFAVAEPWMVPILSKDRKLLWDMPIMRLFLPENVILPNQPSTINSEPLRLSDAEIIYENSDYQAYLSMDYVRERILNGYHACVRIEDKPVAWAMTHDDGAIGFLHVMPEVRKNGYGLTVTVAIVEALRNKGEIPFVHIEEKNIKSMNLAKKLGFVEDRIITWFAVD